MQCRIAGARGLCAACATCEHASSDHPLARTQRRTEGTYNSVSW
jgi:hypothetical protein